MHRELYRDYAKIIVSHLRKIDGIDLGDVSDTTMLIDFMLEQSEGKMLVDFFNIIKNEKIKKLMEGYGTKGFIRLHNAYQGSCCKTDEKKKAAYLADECDMITTKDTCHFFLL